ncbi:hypothetical protein JCM8202_001814 [Rhodotorula sphaerocarpa]
MVGFGAIAPILVLYLELLDFSARQIGLFLSLTLLGDVLVSLVVAWIADRIGRRKMLALGSAAMAGSGLAFVFARGYGVLLVAATLGVISPSGNEVGPFSSLETAMLSQLAPAGEPLAQLLPFSRSPSDASPELLMYYQLLGFLGLALGSVASGLIIGNLQKRLSRVDAYRTVFAAYAAIGVLKIILSVLLTRQTELEKAAPRDGDVGDVGGSSERESVGERQPLLPTGPPLRSSVSTPHVEVPTRPVDTPEPSSASPPPGVPLWRLAVVVALFAVDAFASSLTPASYVALFLERIYRASIETVTVVLAGAALSAVVFSLATGALTKRVGLVLAMVFSHLPAQLITCGLAFAPSLAVAISLYTARTALSSMDSSIRGALLAAMVPPEARTRLLGIVDVTRTLVATPGPFVTGRLVEINALRWTFVISGGIKIACDLALLGGFRKARFEH